MLSAPPSPFVGSEEWEYVPGRKIRKGDRVRVSGGPIWKDAAGVAHRVGDHGVFTFDCLGYDRRGRGFIVVVSEFGGHFCIPLGSSARSRYGVSGWVNRAYRFAKVRARG